MKWALVVLGLVSTVAEITCPKTASTKWSGTELSGSPAVTDDYAACCTKCSQTSECRFFHYSVGKDTDKHCHMFSAVSSSAASSDHDSGKLPDSPTPAIPSLEVLVMGDWGGSDVWPYTTADEVATAAALKKKKEEVGSSFVMALGDNFYSSGVQSADDKRFQHTFEDVFDASLDDFRVLAGNHDYAGNVNAQVEYSQKSKRWNFPSLHYTFTEKTPDGQTVDFVMLDSCNLAGVAEHNHTDSTQCPEEVCRTHSTGAQLDGSTVPDKEASEDQWTWIQDTLSQSTAEFLVVAAHYPVYSIAEHGPTAALVKRLQPMLQQYEVTAYLCGHDHAGEYLQDPADPSKVDYHVVGAAHLVDSSTAHSSAVPKDALQWHSGDSKTKGMFARITVNTDGFSVKHYANTGDLLYTAPTKKARSMAVRAKAAFRAQAKVQDS